MLSPQSPEDLAEIERLISGGDPEFFEEDLSLYDPPAPLSAADAAAADAILKRASE